jgi:hypothetical protein
MGRHLLASQAQFPIACFPCPLFVRRETQFHFSVLMAIGSALQGKAKF